MLVLKSILELLHMHCVNSFREWKVCISLVVSDKDTQLNEAKL